MTSLKSIKKRLTSLLVLIFILYGSTRSALFRMMEKTGNARLSL
ncbi:hypothetical protein FOZG_12981 [Fusarium oxysporum Fo47]|uniref:Uncharacterized protein n=1 Tax=Fusarium oxysporum Fo47 TaxID=660027 RepID=W9JRV5_FUSOX|nr:hypothetical protein FOZG_12981 [Fusarium oxysporum Fo47]